MLLQEIWSIPARDRLIQDVAPKYPYCKHAPALGVGPAAMQASGLVLFSRYPLEDFAFQEFTKGFGGDKLVRKGIVGVRLKKEGRTAAIFTTHLQAGGKKDPSVKPDQLRECNAFIQKFTEGQSDAAVVLAGDFNISSNDRAEYDAIFQRLPGARDSFNKSLSLLTGTTRNDRSPDKRIDYLLTFGPAEAVSTIVDPAGPRLSDHLAVFGAVDFQ